MVLLRECMVREGVRSAEQCSEAPEPCARAQKHNLEPWTGWPEHVAWQAHHPSGWRKSPPLRDDFEITPGASRTTPESPSLAQDPPCAPSDPNSPRQATDTLPARRSYHDSVNGCLLCTYSFFQHRLTKPYHHPVPEKNEIAISRDSVDFVGELSR